MFVLFIYIVLFQAIHHHHNASTALPSMSLLSSLLFANSSSYFPIMFVIIDVAIAAHQRLQRSSPKCTSTRVRECIRFANNFWQNIHHFCVCIDTYLHLLTFLVGSINLLAYTIGHRYWHQQSFMTSVYDPFTFCAHFL